MRRLAPPACRGDDAMNRVESVTRAFRFHAMVVGALWCRRSSRIVRRSRSARCAAPADRAVFSSDRLGAIGEAGAIGSQRGSWRSGKVGFVALQAFSRVSRFVVGVWRLSEPWVLDLAIRSGELRCEADGSRQKAEGDRITSDYVLPCLRVLKRAGLGL